MLLMLLSVSCLTLKNIITDGKFSDTCIGNMDETPFWFDLPSTATIDMEGVKTVKAQQQATKNCDLPLS